MPRGIGHTRLASLLAINPNPATWTSAELTAAAPAGLTAKTIESIVAAIPAATAWRTANFPGLVLTSPTIATAAATSPTILHALTAPTPAATVVLTGFRDKALEAALQAAGHSVADTVTRKTTHVVYPDGPEPTSTKITKARGTGARVMSLSVFRAAIGLSAA